MVSDEQFATRETRFPLNPPTTKEYYLLREIFEEHFVTGMENGDCAYATCPFGKSIACSTPEAVAWDPEWENSVGDISGRAVKNVHVAGDKFDLKADGAGKENTASTKEKKPAEAASVMAIGGHTRDRGSVAVKAAKQGAAGRKKGGASFIGGAARGGRAAVKSRFVGLRAVKASAVAFA
jgi:asparagine synthase (glutamine-hydrolysing)